MKLCTFEVSTPVGRHRRVGALKDGVITDLNFATAWYLQQQGEAEPQRLADALVPAAMPDFLAAGLRAMHTAEELFLGDGPRPADWWKHSPPPKGPNDETLVYLPREIRLLAPLFNPSRVGTDEEVRCGDTFITELKLAAIIGKQGSSVRAIEARQHIAGFTAMNDLGTRTALGPYLVTPDELGNPYDLTAVVRVNGEERARASSANLRPKFEDAIERLSSGDPILPGDIIAFPFDCSPEVRTGDLIEFEVAKIGTLRTRAV